MGMSTNINAYSDIAEVLAQALPYGTAQYTLETPGLARRWVQRAYKYRILLQKQEALRAGVKNFTPPTPYDKMKLYLDGHNVNIDFAPKPSGVLTLPDVTPQAVESIAVPSAPKPAAFLNLQLAAEELLRSQEDEN